MLHIAVPRDGHDNGNFRYEVGAGHPPIATVEHGTAFGLQTLDAYSGRYVQSEDLLDEAFFAKVLPVTGPIAVEGTSPGDWLAVQVRKIETWEHGTMILRHGKGLLGRERKDPPAAYRFDVSAAHATHPTLGRFAVQPMIGTIWLAPNEGTHWSGLVGDHAGNIDCPELGEGATIVLPVEVAGASLYVGDGHAIMGHGELGSTGIEIGLDLELFTFAVSGPSPDSPLRLPMLLAADGWMAAIGQGGTLDDAAINALSGLQGWLEHWDCDERDARIALQGEARICQIVNNRYTVAVGIYPHPELGARIGAWSAGAAGRTE